MPLQPEYFSFDALLYKRLFKIPNYQRAYSWGFKQRRDLFNDIENLMKSHHQNQTHFMSMVVCLITNEKIEIGTDQYPYVEIVDGQQRLTTLIIILKAVQKLLAIGPKKQKEEGNRLQKILVKDNKDLILLQANHDSSLTFRGYITKGTIPDASKIKTAADKNLVNAFKECEEFVDKWIKTYNLLDLLRLIKYRLDFVFYALEDEGTVYRIFEALNSRGLDVDWLDKCKCSLMGIGFENGLGPTVLGEMHKLWSKIYQTIGIKNIPGYEILGFAATLKQATIQNRPMGSQDALNYFLESSSGDPNSIVESSEWLLSITDKLNNLYENRRIEAVTDIVHARLLAVAINLAEQLDADQKKKCLEQWEIVTFRIFGIYRKDARTRSGDYTRLACKITQNKLEYDSIMKDLIKLGSGFPIDEGIEDYLSNTDCYNEWEKDLRYFLYRYEESLYDKNISEVLWTQIWEESPSTTIEHICPQAARENDLEGWINVMGKYPLIVEENINRIGNLIVLPPGVNSQCGKKDFEGKKKIYKKFKAIKMVSEIIYEDEDGEKEAKQWNLKRMVAREKKLLSWAKNAWADIENDSVD